MTNPYYRANPDMSARDILADMMQFDDDTLDYIDRIDCLGQTIGWDMSTLIAKASQYDADIRAQKAADRRYYATKRLIRILAKALATAVKNDDLDAAECLAYSIKHHTYSLSAL